MWSYLLKLANINENIKQKIWKKWVWASFKVSIWNANLYPSTQSEPSETSFLVFSVKVFRSSSLGFLKDLPKLFFGCWLPIISFSVKMIPHCFNNVEVRALGRIHPSIKPVATDFQPTSCVIWHSSAFSPRFLLLRMTSWQPRFHGDHFWWGFSEQ